MDIRTLAPVVINGLCAAAFQTSTDKGFHDNDEPPPVNGAVTDTVAFHEAWRRLHDSQRLMLMADEISEAHDLIRMDLSVQFGEDMDPYGVWLVCHNCGDANILPEHHGCTDEEGSAHYKPEGVPIELADAVIRIMDFCGQRGIDLGSAILQKMDYNEGRPHMHGKAF